MYIIGEYLFIENFIINYTILQSTKIITRTKVTRFRVLITAIIAALYSFVIFLPSIMFLTNFYMKIIISILIVKLAFNSKCLSLFLKQLSGFYIISFIFAGASIGTYYFSQSYKTILAESNISIGFPVKYVFLGTLLGGIMIRNILHYFHEKVSTEKKLLEVTVHFNDNKASLVSLIDTGNSLIEPISKIPVLVVEYTVIKHILPPALREIFDNNIENDFVALGNVMENIKDELKIKLIPFNSVGSNNRLLIGFKPNYIQILDHDSLTTYDELVIGITNTRLSADEQYSGLLNLEILNRGNLCVDKD